MQKLLTRLILLSLIPSLVWSATVRTGHPRVLLLPSEVSSLQARCTTAGQAQTEYDATETWVDAHISDTISGISTTPTDDNNLASHLTRTSMSYVVTGTASYGRRVVDLLDYIADNYSIDPFYGITPDGGDNNYVPDLAMAVGYDWCYDQLDYDSEKQTITDYLFLMVETAIITNNNYLATNANKYKTEENWTLTFIAYAVFGETGVTSEAQTAIDRHVDWVGDWTGAYTDVSPNGGFPFLGTYVADQVSRFRAIYFEVIRTGSTDVEYWSLTDSTNDVPEPSEDSGNDGCDSSKHMLETLVYATPPDTSNIVPRSGDSGVDTESIHWAGGSGDIGAFCMSISSWVYAKRYQNPIIQYGHTIALQQDTNYGRNSYDLNRFDYNFFWCLWRDVSLTPSVSSANKYNFYETGSQFILRSGYDYSGSSTDILISSASLKKHYYDHFSSDLGHFLLSRADDWLLINAGDYNYNESWSINHDRQPISHNTIMVNDAPHLFVDKGDPGDNYDDTHSPQGAENNYGEMTKTSSADGDYAYSKIDISNSYSDTTATVLARAFVFINDKFLVVKDDVVKANASYPTKVMFQSVVEPVADGNDWSDTGVDNYDDVTWSTFSITNGGSKLYADILYPTTNVVLRQVGNTSADRSFDELYADQGGDSDAWRVEVMPAAGSIADRILTVLEPLSNVDGQIANSLITAGSFIGAEIRDTVRCAVLFSLDGALQNSASFSVTDTSGTLKAVVCDLSADIYSINGSGSNVVDSNGVLYFEADLATTSSFVIAAGAASSQVTKTNTGTQGTRTNTGAQVDRTN